MQFFQRLIQLDRRARATTLASVSAFALAFPSFTFAAAAATTPSEPGVARISNVTGAVAVHRADANGTYAAALNAPVTAGDYVETKPGARTEIEFDGATALRAAPSTQLRVTRVAPADHEVQLAQGTVEMRLFRGTTGHPVIQTPSVDVRPDIAGRYRVSVDGSGTTLVAVRSGRVDVGTGSSRRTLGPGSALEISGSGASLRFRSRGDVAYDSFDGWCDGRDAGWSRVSDWTYADAGMVGASDLADDGTWVDDAQYGQSWQPGNEPADWTPYSDGRFVWETGYGWTWIGNEPWGYAPYHYGRWFQSSDRHWRWAPGRYDSGRSYAYEPAVVGFFALGSGIGISFSIGDIGWVPLAPGEAFDPWWGGGNGYDQPRSSRAAYRNGRYRGAAVAVSGRDFAAGRFAHVRRLGAGDYARAVAVRGAVPIVPTSRNLGYDGRALGPQRGAALSARFRKMNGPAVETVAFAKQRTAIAALARTQHPAYAASLARQAKAPGNGSGFTRTTLVGTAAITKTTHPKALAKSGTPATASRANTVPKKTTAYVAPKKTNTYVAPKKTNAYAAPRKTTNTYVAPKRANTYVAPRKTTNTYVAPKKANTYVAPRKTTNAYVAPKRTNAYVAPKKTTNAYVAPHAVTHTYVAPVTHTYVAPVTHTYVAPVTHTYVAPVTHTYVAPVTHTYVAPHPVTHTYVAPAPVVAPVHVAPRAPAPPPPAHVDDVHH